MATYLYTVQWHMTRSEGLRDLAVKPLERFGSFEPRLWSDHSPPDHGAQDVLLFYQVLPDTTWLLRQRARMVWLPMLDDVECHSLEWWRQLPQSLKIVSFSAAISKMARAAGLRCLDVRYFKDPDDLTPAPWAGERVLWYWNRRGLVSPRFLERFCEALGIDRLLFREEVDPTAGDGAAYQLPSRLGRTVVEPLPRLAGRDDYWRRLSAVNVVIAPRIFEGVGLVALEMLARGCAVFAYDAPTMSEYIAHGQDGFLFQRRGLYERIRDAASRRLGFARHAFVHPVSINQNWGAIATTNLASLGANAREKQARGSARWRRAWPEMAEFILGESARGHGSGLPNAVPSGRNDGDDPRRAA